MSKIVWSKTCFLHNATTVLRYQFEKKFQFKAMSLQLWRSAVIPHTCNTRLIFFLAVSNTVDKAICNNLFFGFGDQTEETRHIVYICHNCNVYTEGIHILPYVVYV